MQTLELRQQSRKHHNDGGLAAGKRRRRWKTNANLVVFLCSLSFRARGIMSAMRNEICFFLLNYPTFSDGKWQKTLFAKRQR